MAKGGGVMSGCEQDAGQATACRPVAEDLIAVHRFAPAPRRNTLGQPIGPALPTWTTRPIPTPQVLRGRLGWLEPLDVQRHAAALYVADSLDVDGASWTYLPYGPFASFADYQAWAASAVADADRLFYAIIDADGGVPLGVAAYLRIDPAVGSLEVGHLHYSPRLQRTALATEAHYLLMRHAFDDLGYRRYEWKCDSLNVPSMAAARRLGFQYEGTFRNATVYKGRSRDTAWFAVTDADWPALKARFERWLEPDNFDADGRQRHPL